VISLKRREKTTGVKLARHQVRALAVFGFATAVDPIMARLFHDLHIVQLVWNLLTLTMIWPILYEQWKKRHDWIDSEIAAGRTPKEARVYNDWARPDPE